MLVESRSRIINPYRCHCEGASVERRFAVVSLPPLLHVNEVPRPVVYGAKVALFDRYRPFKATTTFEMPQLLTHIGLLFHLTFVNSPQAVPRLRFNLALNYVVSGLVCYHDVHQVPMAMVGLVASSR